MAASYRKTPVLESLFNSEYCEIFKSTYFEEHLRTAASENVFMKLRNITIYSYEVLILYQVFSTSIPETSSWMIFHDWFPVKFIFTYNTSLKKDQKFKKRICRVNVKVWKFDQRKTFSENYKPMRVWLRLIYKIYRELLSLATFPSSFKLKRGIPSLLTKYVS